MHSVQSCAFYIGNSFDYIHFVHCHSQHTKKTLPTILRKCSKNMMVRK